jgi:hypothetical protein
MSRKALLWDIVRCLPEVPIAGSALRGLPRWAIGGRRYERIAAALLRSSFGSRVRRSRPPGPLGGGDARSRRSVDGSGVLGCSTLAQMR